MKIVRFLDRTQPPNLTAVGIHAKYLNLELKKIKYTILNITTHTKHLINAKDSDNIIHYFPYTLQLLGNRIIFNKIREMGTLIRNFEPKLIHSHSHLFYTTLIGSYFSKKFKLPHIITIHGMIQPMSDFGMIFQKIYSFFTLKYIYRSAYFLVYTNLMQKQLMRYGIPSKNIFVINNAVISDDTKIPQVKAKRPLKIAFIGRFTKGKGIPELLDIITNLNKLNIELILAGDGPLRSQLLAFCNKSKIKYSYYGTLKHQKVLDLLREVHILLQPSKQEGVSRIILEAISQNCIVLSNTNDGLKKFIEIGAIRTSNLSLTNGIKEICMNYDKFYSQIDWEFCYKLLIEHYSWKNYAKKMDDIYRILVKKSSKQLEIVRS